MIAVAMEMLGVPALIFALGMYLPLELNTPALVGGFLSHMVGKRSERAGGAARPHHPRARRDHRLGPHGRRRARRRLRRRAAALPVVRGGPDQDAVLRQRRASRTRSR